MSGDPFSPQGPRTPHGHGSTTAVVIIAVLTLAFLSTFPLLWAGVLER